MKQGLLFPSGIFFIAIAAFMAGCNSNQADRSDISTDAATIAKGKALFSANCESCHSIAQDGIGPHLGGITLTASPDWIKNFIKNPDSTIQTGDDRSVKLVARYKTTMPSFAHLGDENLDAVIAYLNSEEAPDMQAEKSAEQELVDPIPSPIASSDLVVGLELVTQIPFTAPKGFRTRITKLSYIPKTDRIFVVDIRGRLYELRGGKPMVYMDMAQLKPHFIDEPGLATGFGSFAFHPEFTKNGLLYTGHTEAAGTAIADFHYADSIPVAMQWVVSEWKVEDPAAFPFRGKSRELFRINMVTGAHGVQELTFNPNSKPGDEDYGLLYIGIGDGSSVQAGYPFLPNNVTRPWGTIFRIDPRGHNSANGQYGIPDTNPFVKSNPKALGEIYAYGFRNPHRITWTKSGLMLGSHIGQSKVEELNLIQPGRCYGWPLREGTFVIHPQGDINKVYPLPADDAKLDLTYPVAQYDHDEGAAIIGGFEYRGQDFQALKGKYIFADMNNGRLYYVNLAEIRQGHLATVREWKAMYNGKIASMAELCGSKHVDLRLGQDMNGDIYVFSKRDGKIYRLVPPKETVAKAF